MHAFLYSTAMFVSVVGEVQSSYFMESDLVFVKVSLSLPV